MLTSIVVSPIFVVDMLSEGMVELKKGIFSRSWVSWPMRSVSSEERKASGREGVPSTHAGPV